MVSPLAHPYASASATLSSSQAITLLLTLLQSTIQQVNCDIQEPTVTTGQGSSGDRDAQRCKPQGLLALEQPYPPPYFTPAGGLPVCPQFKCSCCNRGHVLSILRSLAPAKARLDAPESDGLSSKCMDMLTLIGCRVCDPQVGTGLKSKVCGNTCNAWYKACSDDFFTFDGYTGQLLPCPAGGPGPGSPPCSRLADMASNGQDLCSIAGYEITSVGSSELCYDGSDPSLPEGFCSKDDKRSSFSSKSGSKESGRERKRRKLKGDPNASAADGFSTGIPFLDSLYDYINDNVMVLGLVCSLLMWSLGASRRQAPPLGLVWLKIRQQLGLTRNERHRPRFAAHGG